MKLSEICVQRPVFAFMLIMFLVTMGWFAFRLPSMRAIVRPIYVERGIVAAAEIEAGAKAL